MDNIHKGRLTEYYCNFSISGKGCTKFDYNGIKPKYPSHTCREFDGNYSVLRYFAISNPIPPIHTLESKKFHVFQLT